ncbi:hypothetical protein TWF694_006056 [Orbilia ellipsospora]|uniref:CHAT domain-containing protein n=1 Tax=Orbilia ellipsospora TaxID=2528407 RepID=A0AAV9WR66_9PEZI
MSAPDDFRGAFDMKMALFETSDNFDPAEDPDMDLLDMAELLQMRASRGRHNAKNRADIEASLDILHKLTRPKILEGSNYPDILADTYLFRFLDTGRIDDLNQCIKYRRLTLDATSKSNPVPFFALTKLGDSLRTRFKCLKDIRDLNEAISLTDRALNAIGTEDIHPFRCEILISQSENMLALYANSADEGCLIRFAECVRGAWKGRGGAPHPRIRVGRYLANVFARDSDWEASCKIFTEVVQLLITLSPRSLRHFDRHDNFRGSLGIGSDTAATLLAAGRDPFQALSYLEMARGVASSQMLDMRSDISDLQNAHPELAAHFITLREQLDPLVDMDSAVVPGSNGMVVELGKQRREAALQLDDLLKKIRTKPGFQSFLLASSKKEILYAAGSNYIVVINVSCYRCDAFIINGRSIKVLSLPELREEDINGKADQLREPSDAWEVLEWLWDAVASPILTALEITGPPKNEWPHIIWIPTGALSRLPLHAAGRHLENSNESVLDRVISSYSSTIKMHGTRRPTHTSNATARTDFLIVSMPKTAGQPDLPFTGEEVAVLERVCPDLSLKAAKISSPAEKEAVVQGLQTCKIFHFAGHGISDPIDPSQSRLLLDDWQTNPLTVQSLWEQRMQDDPPFLAYLSACSTGATDDAELLDEGIHLTTACQLAGFRHVIGSLWEVSDSHCVEVAKTVYETLDERMEDESVAFGLHKALRILRKQSVEDSLENGYTSRAGLPFDKKIKPSNRRTVERNFENMVGSVKKSGSLQLEHRDTSLEIGDNAAAKVENNERAPRCARNAKLVNLHRPALHWVPYVHFGTRYVSSKPYEPGYKIRLVEYSIDSEFMAH